MPDTVASDCECKLAIVDVPVADSNSMYRDYVANNWKTFDCVILVMDSRQGVNSEERIRVLKFAKANMIKKKVPVIILFNKVDGLDIQEELQVIQEAQEKVNGLFNVPKRLHLIEEIMDRDFSFSKWDKSMPIFLPISARNGYVYRLAQTVDKERFKLLEKDLVEALGREQIGLRHWNNMNQTQKYDAAYEAISEQEVYQEGIESSNFQKFLSNLHFCVGGDQTQSLLMEQQIRVRLATFTHEERIAQELTFLYDRIQVFPHLSSAGDALHTLFWRQYKKMSVKCNEVTRTSHLTSHKPIEELKMYYGLATKAGWQEEQHRVIDASLEYLNSYVQTVFDSLSSVSLTGNLQDVLKKTKDITKLRELLDATTHFQFGKHPFQQARLVIEMEHHRAIARLCDFKVEVCESCGKPLDDGTYHYHERGSKSCIHLPSRGYSDQFCPMKGCDESDATLQKRVLSGKWECHRCQACFDPCPKATKPIKLVYVPGGWKVECAPTGTPLHIYAPNRQLSNPEHFCHAFWQFCEWMNSIEMEK